MPFLLYDLDGPPGREKYTLVSTFQLSGTRGAMARLVAARNVEKQVPFSWHATAAELIAVGRGQPTTQAIVIDLKPKVANNVSLFRLLDVWGYSYGSWTPLALRLQGLMADRQEPDPVAFKKSFIDPGDDHSLVGEFLYVQGGVNSGKWTWGMVGRVNGALLWKNAFDFLTGALARGLSTDGSVMQPS